MKMEFCFEGMLLRLNRCETVLKIFHARSTWISPRHQTTLMIMMIVVIGCPWCWVGYSCSSLDLPLDNWRSNFIIFDLWDDFWLLIAARGQICPNYIAYIHFTCSLIRLSYNIRAWLAEAYLAIISTIERLNLLQWWLLSLETVCPWLHLNFY